EPLHGARGMIVFRGEVDLEQPLGDLTRTYAANGTKLLNGFFLLEGEEPCLLDGGLEVSPSTCLFPLFDKLGGGAKSSQGRGDLCQHADWFLASRQELVELP